MQIVSDKRFEELIKRIADNLEAMGSK